MTLLDKYNKIRSLIEERVQAFIQQQKDLPQEFYEVTYRGELKEYLVLKVIHFNSKQPLWYNGKKPTREDVRKIESFFYNLELDVIHFRFQYDNAGNSRSLEEIHRNKMFFLDRDEAKTLAKQISERICQEERLLANGHERCQRCRKVVPKEQIQIHTIIGRGRQAVYNSWKNRYEDKACITHEKMKFCSGECAGTEQMSREG